jgi:hypothetical protein
MQYQIKNFQEASALSVQGHQHTFPDASNPTALVTVSQSSAGMSFMHTMTPQQARWMASALQMAANDAEQEVGVVA